MVDSALEHRIAQLNPWLVHPDKASDLIRARIPVGYVPRKAESTPPRAERALLVVGPRQAGKTTLAWKLLQSYGPDILFLNMEDPLLREQLASPWDLIDFIRRDWPGVGAVFIDEIQHMSEAGLFVKGLVDAKMGIPVLVTGSSAFDLRAKTRESLAGRATRRFLGPFGLSELLAPDQGPPVARHLAARAVLDNQLIFGSYPAVFTAESTKEKTAVLSDLVEALILRDASDLFRIQRVDAFRRLLALLAVQTGNLLNHSELAAICSVDVGTVASYLEIMEESHIIRKLPPFAEGKRREITATPKVFFIDNGIRNQLLLNFQADLELRADKGALFENWVFSEIRKALPFQDSLRFWRSKSQAEVDFVIMHGAEILAVEAKYSSSPQLSRSAMSFIEAYRPSRFVVVNRDHEARLDRQGTEVKFMTPARFCDWLEEVFASAI